jgi:hypothetical protein
MGEVKRGFRKVTLVLPVKDYEALVRQAEMNDREPGQQAAFLLKRAMLAHQRPGMVDELDGNGEWEGLSDQQRVEAVDNGVMPTTLEVEPAEVE